MPAGLGGVELRQAAGRGAGRGATVALTARRGGLGAGRVRKDAPTPRGAESRNTLPPYDSRRRRLGAESCDVGGVPWLTLKWAVAHVAHAELGHGSGTPRAYIWEESLGRLGVPWWIWSPVE